MAKKRMGINEKIMEAIKHIVTDEEGIWTPAGGLVEELYWLRRDYSKKEICPGWSYADEICVAIENLIKSGDIRLLSVNIRTGQKLGFSLIPRERPLVAEIIDVFQIEKEDGGKEALNISELTFHLKQQAIEFSEQKLIDAVNYLLAEKRLKLNLEGSFESSEISFLK